MKNIFIFMMCLGISVNLLADTDGIVELAQGSCWVYSDKEQVKLTSFNEAYAYQELRENIQTQISELLDKQHYFFNSLTIKNLNLGIHCGGYGASIVAKIDSDQGSFCLWGKVSDKKISMRSFGVEAKVEGDLCHGYKWGELIIGSKTKDNDLLLNELKSDQFKILITSIEQVTAKVYKIKLNQNYYLNEETIKNELLLKLSDKGVSFIEYNTYQHPVGEFLNLK
jgi:hypothetical protein